MHGLLFLLRAVQSLNTVSHLFTYLKILYLLDSLNDVVVQTVVERWLLSSSHLVFDGMVSY